MIVIYYYNERLKYCPVKKYLEQYLPDKKDSDEVGNRKLKLLIDIDRKIQKLLQLNGRPTPPISTPIKEYGCIEIKHRKNQDILIRIMYFVYSDKLVLLHSFEKPDNYDTQKIKREVNKQYEITQEYKKLFINNPKLYEEYKI